MPIFGLKMGQMRRFCHPKLAKMMEARRKTQGTVVYVAKNAITEKKAPTIVYAHNKVFFIGIRSATIPRRGLVTATIAVDAATLKLHIELPVNTNPKSSAFSPIESLNNVTKYMGYIAAIPLVAKAELAQSNIHQALMAFLCFTGKSPIFICPSEGVWYTKSFWECGPIPY